MSGLVQFFVVKILFIQERNCRQEMGVMVGYVYIYGKEKKNGILKVKMRSYINSLEIIMFDYKV